MIISLAYFQKSADQSALRKNRRPKNKKASKNNQHSYRHSPILTVFMSGEPRLSFTCALTVVTVNRRAIAAVSCLPNAAIAVSGPVLCRVVWRRHCGWVGAGPRASVRVGVEAPPIQRAAAQTLSASIGLQVLQLLCNRFLIAFSDCRAACFSGD